MPKAKKSPNRSKPYPEQNLRHIHFLQSNRSRRRNAVANILDEPQVAANLPILTLPAALSELKVMEDVTANKRQESQTEFETSNKNSNDINIQKD